MFTKTKMTESKSVPQQQPVHDDEAIVSISATPSTTSNAFYGNKQSSNNQRELTKTDWIA
jgi:hypothetical protein